ncbi:MAG: hypothetical protein K0U52_02235 [Gammaproteobacteria bacterium]|nr:hypothetical protein [Gammaproteobacteria bacterium]
MTEHTLALRIRELNPANTRPSTPIALGLSWLSVAAELAREHMTDCEVSLTACRTREGGTVFAMAVGRDNVAIWNSVNSDAEQLAFEFAALAEGGTWS